MIHPHWHYFLALESDLEQTSRYVEVIHDNFETYSIEYVGLLLSAGSEIDVVCKLLCERIDSSRTYRNIDQYRPTITNEFPQLHTMQVLIPRYAITLEPWTEWGGTVNPAWWRSYNNVKHRRDDCYNEANLENTLNAIAGLFCIVLYYYNIEARVGGLWGEPKLFHLEVEPGRLQLESGYGLPDF